METGGSGIRPTGLEKTLCDFEGPIRKNLSVILSASFDAPEHAAIKESVYDIEGLIAIHSHATQKNIGDTEEKISLHIIHVIHRRKKLFRKLCWMTISGLTKIIRHIGNAFSTHFRKISNQRNIDRKGLTQ